MPTSDQVPNHSIPVLPEGAAEVVSELCNAIAETLWTAQLLWMVMRFVSLFHIFCVALFMKTSKVAKGDGSRRPSFPWESCFSISG